MKAKLLLVSSMMLACVASCSESKDEPTLIQEIETADNTRSAELTTDHYYYYNADKIYVNYSDTQSYVLYHASDEEIVVNKLKEMGVSVNRDEAQWYGLNQDLFPKAYEMFGDCKFISVALDYKKVLNISEIIYASPYVQSLDTPTWWPMANKCTVAYNGRLEELEQILKDYNVILWGKDPDLFSVSGDVYIIGCTRDSKYNALDLAATLYETGLFVWTDPCLLGIYC